MVACSAYGCSNRSDQGYAMKRFPTDPIRRKIWQRKTRRAGWVPGPYAVLCECHFAHDDFENKRLDGKRLLRWNAIPSIFDFTEHKKTRRSDRKKQCKELPDHGYACYDPELANKLPRPKPPEQFVLVEGPDATDDPAIIAFLQQPKTDTLKSNELSLSFNLTDENTHTDNSPNHSPNAEHRPNAEHSSYIDVDNPAKDLNSSILLANELRKATSNDLSKLYIINKSQSSKSLSNVLPVKKYKLRSKPIKKQAKRNFIKPLSVNKILKRKAQYILEEDLRNNETETESSNDVIVWTKKQTDGNSSGLSKDVRLNRLFDRNSEPATSEQAKTVIKDKIKHEYSCSGHVLSKAQSTPQSDTSNTKTVPNQSLTIPSAATPSTSSQPTSECQCKHEIDRLKSLLRNMAKKLDEVNKYIPTHLLLKNKGVFTKEQQKFAATLYCHGPFAYQFLRKVGFPLPSYRHLTRWLYAESKQKKQKNSLTKDISVETSNMVDSPKIYEASTDKHEGQCDNNEVIYVEIPEGFKFDENFPQIINDLYQKSKTDYVNSKHFTDNSYNKNYSQDSYINTGGYAYEVTEIPQQQTDTTFIEPPEIVTSVEHENNVENDHYKDTLNGKLQQNTENSEIFYRQQTMEETTPTSISLNSSTIDIQNSYASFTFNERVRVTNSGNFPQQNEHIDYYSTHLQNTPSSAILVQTDDTNLNNIVDNLQRRLDNGNSPSIVPKSKTISEPKVICSSNAVNITNDIEAWSAVQILQSLEKGYNS